MDKKELQRLREWAKKKVKEGFTINQLKFALRRKGIEEKDAEKIVSRIGINYKFLISLFVVMGLLTLSLVLLYLPTSVEEETRINVSKLAEINFEGFSRNEISNGFAFTRVEENASPTVITLSGSYEEIDKYLNDFLKRNLKSYKSFKPISRWKDGRVIANDYTYQSVGKEFIVSQRVLLYNETLIDLSIRSERKLYNESKEIANKKIEEIESLFSN